MSENEKILAAAALAVVLAGGVAVSLDGADEGDLRGEPGTVAGRVVSPDYATELPDGAVGYAVQVETDAGITWSRKAAPGCVRRRAGAPVAACRRRLSDGGTTDPGDLNRFPAAEGVGGQCQPVACAVFAGDDADAEEVEIVKGGGGDADLVDEPDAGTGEEAQ